MTAKRRLGSSQNPTLLLITSTAICFISLIAAFFTIYYDYLYHNHSGEIVKGKRTNLEYTFDLYNKMYIKKFIADNFGKEENERVEQFIEDAYKTRKKK